MTPSRALACEPRHRTGGGAGDVRAEVVPLWHGQKVKLAKRLWGKGLYAHGAVRYAAQLAALDQRGHRCRAGVATLAALMGDGKRTAERYLAQLDAPARDGIEAMETIRHTDPGGRGTTAERRMRRPAPGEHFAYVDVCAVKALRPAAFVLYCALTYADALGIRSAAADLAELLDVSERTVRRLLAELAAGRWITVEHRTGYQARHDITVNGCPGHGSPATPPGPDTDGGSGPDTGGGSLAIKEDPGLTDGEKTQPGGSSAVGEVTVSALPTARSSVDTASNATRCNYPVAPAVPAALRGRVRPLAPPEHAGGQFALSPRVWAVLEPVRDLLPGIRPYVLRRIAREIGAQLDAGYWPEEIRDQIARLRAWTPDQDLPDPGRWLLGAVLPVRSRCGRPGCHWGFLAHTGEPCKACAEPAATPPEQPPPAAVAPLPPPRRTAPPEPPPPAPPPVIPDAGRVRQLAAGIRAALTAPHTNRP
ncbi:hypothetical protein [Streptomyces sp. NPDC005760]|uniref:hypothetical protein n=1 Tax=Streptomyces sp. NPDC005760 TaxID=3156718 RepID=UPI0033F3013B